MSLTGRGIILLSIALTGLATAGTVLLWRRGGRWRMPVRLLGLAAVECLVVLTAGLALNHHEGFYPSWQALFGTYQNKKAPPPPVGRLDRRLAANTVVTWSPAELTRWRLAGSPTLVVPVDYARHPNLMYPVIVVLTAADRVAAIRAQAAATSGAVTVIAVPTRDTAATELATLPTSLIRDVRATDTGWAIVTDPAHTALAGRWTSLAIARFCTVAGTLAAAADRLPPPLTTAVRLDS